MRYIVLEDILSKEETQIIKSEAGVETFKIDFKAGNKGFDYTVSDLISDINVNIKFVETETDTVIHYVIDLEEVASVSISREILGKPIEIEMYEEVNMTTRGTLPDHNLTILQNSDILARIDTAMFRPESTYLINIDDNTEHRALLLAICVSLDKFLQENKGDDDHRRRLFGTRFEV